MRAHSVQRTYMLPINYANHPVSLFINRNYQKQHLIKLVDKQLHPRKICVMLFRSLLGVWTKIKQRAYY